MNQPPEVGQRLSRALRNRRVLLALAMLIVAAIVAFMPELESLQDELMTLIMAFLLALVGDYTMRDAARIGHEHGVNGLGDPHDEFENDEVSDAQ